MLAAKATAVPMRDATSFWGWALWIPAIVCFANLLQNIFYIWWAHTRPEWARIPTGRQLVTKSKQYNGTQDANNGPRSMSTTGRGLRRFTASSIWRAINNVPRFFWLMACTQILQAGVVSSFNGLNADIITTTRGSTAQIAGYTSSVQQVIPIICTPLIGFFFDTFGYRMMIISFTSAIWILVYCLIGFTQTNALGTMVIASLGSAFNAIPFLVSIPLVVTSQAELGLVFGIWKAFNNGGTVVVDMIAGRLQDITPGGTYERVITFFVAVKGLEFCLGMFYGVFDRRYVLYPRLHRSLKLIVDYQVPLRRAYYEREEAHERRGEQRARRASGTQAVETVHSGWNKLAVCYYYRCMGPIHQILDMRNRKRRVPCMGVSTINSCYKIHNKHYNDRTKAPVSLCFLSKHSK